MGWLPRVVDLLGADVENLSWDLSRVLKAETRPPPRERNAVSEISEAQRAFAGQFVIIIQTMTAVCGLGQ